MSNFKDSTYQVNVSVILPGYGRIPPYAYTQDDIIKGYLPDVISIACSSETIRCTVQNVSTLNDGFEVMRKEGSDVFLDDNVLTENCYNLSSPMCSAEYGYQRVMILSGVSINSAASMVSSLVSMDLDVWLLWISSWIFVSVSVFLIGKVNFQNKISFSDSCWNTLGCIFSKSVPSEDFISSARWPYISWVLATFILTIAFTVKLQSSLAFFMPNKIDSLQDILDASKIRPVIAANKTIHREFEKSEEGTISQKVWQRINLGNGLLSFPFSNDVMIEVSQRKSVIIAYEDQIFGLVNNFCTSSNERPSFYIGQETIKMLPSVLFYGRNISYYFLEKLNFKLRQLAQSNLQEQYMRTLMHSSQNCFADPKTTDSYQDIALKGVSFLFVLWAVGLTAATFILFLERIVYWMGSIKHRKTVDVNKFAKRQTSNSLKSNPRQSNQQYTNHKCDWCS